MRLIDADEMIKRLQEWNTKDDMDTALFNFALHRILEQPTAYDVDEVVKQLNEKKENLGFIKAITDTSAYIKGINDAIKIFNRLWTNIRNTFVFSTIAIIFIIIIGMLISYIVVRQKGFAGQLMDLLIMFPFVIPGAVLGISLIVAFNKEPVILTGTAVIMIIAFVVRKLPYTVRSGSAFLQQMDPSVEEASISLGVSPMQTFIKVTARLMAPGVLSGAILSWITCINELSSSVMLYGGKTSTISVAIYTEVVRNSFGTAAALASILTVSTVISLLIFLKVSKGKVSIV